MNKDNRQTKTLLYSVISTTEISPRGLSGGGTEEEVSEKVSRKR